MDQAKTDGSTTRDPGQRKGYAVGTHRIRPPAQTVAGLMPLLAQAGITRVANITGLDRIGIPVVSVSRPNARSLSVSQGKGLDLDAAKASGIMEAIESHHAENIGQPLRLASEQEMQAQFQVVSPSTLPQLRDTRHDPERQVLWIEGSDLFRPTPVWVPFEVVHTNYTVPTKAATGCLVASSNGLASGNSTAEAIIHGIAEVVERDAMTLWNQLPDTKIASTRVDLDSIANEACRALLSKLHDANFKIAVWDITSDVGLPAFYCLIVDAERRNGHSGAGAGCHTSADVAMARAITEAVQVRCNYIAGARDDLLPDEYGQDSQQAKRDRAEWLMSLPTRTPRDLGSIASWQNGTLDADLETMLAQLSGAGLDRAACVDLSKPEFGLGVVRIVIPGLEGPDDHPDYTPGHRSLAQRGHPA